MESTGSTKCEKTNFVTRKRKNHSNLGKLFVAPDGGYGWFDLKVLTKTKNNFNVLIQVYCDCRGLLKCIKNCR